MPGGDDRPEGVAEDRKTVELEGLRKQVDVPCEDLEAECDRVDTLAPSLAPLVDIQDAEILGERVEPRPEVRVVEPGASVEDDQRRAGAQLLDEQSVSVGKLGVQRSS